MLIGARTAAWGGKALPYDAEIEYLENINSNSDIRIDTLTYANQDTRVEYKCYGEGSAVSCLSGFAWRPSFGIRIGHGEVSPRWGLNANITYIGISTVGIILNIIQGKDCFVNGYLVRSGPDSGDFTVEDPFIIFNRSNRPNNYDCFIGKIFYVKIFERNVLIRDFIPVRFTNENNVSEGAMYDRVSGFIFRNIGSGSFVVGPDIN